jgi:sec-independent protein translocase protein TatC
MPQYRAQDDLFESSTMTFGQHLEELRRCLFKAILALAIGCGIGLIPQVSGPVVQFTATPVKKALTNYYQDKAKEEVKAREGSLREAGCSDEQIKRIGDIVSEEHKSFALKEYYRPQLLKQLRLRPDALLPAADSASPSDEAIKIVEFTPVADNPRTNMQSLNAQEMFIIYLKASILVGAVLASPWVFYQIWQFVAAGLYPHERRYVHIFLPVSVGLFLSGAAVAYFFAFSKVLDFLLSFNRMMGIDPDLRINEWMSFVLLLPLGFGVSFQLPLVMLFLERIGLFTVKSYLSSWRMAVVIIFVLAMILTPSGDPYTMCLMAVPLTGLYFAGVLLCKLFPRGKSRAA